MKTPSCKYLCFSALFVYSPRGASALQGADEVSIQRGKKHESARQNQGYSAKYWVASCFSLKTVFIGRNHEEFTSWEDFSWMKERLRMYLRPTNEDIITPDENIWQRKCNFILFYEQWIHITLTKQTEESKTEFLWWTNEPGHAALKGNRRDANQK